MAETSDADIIAILNEYSPIVKHIARSACCSSATIDFADLCQVGDLAVLQAIKEYNPSSGTTIKSFISRVVRNEIYREAARFLGVFTVDFRITPLAAKAYKLYNAGHTDLEIASILKRIQNRPITVEDVRDLRIAYGRREQGYIEDNVVVEKDIEESTIHDILCEVVKSDIDKILLNNRILNNVSVSETADLLGISKPKVYELENVLKERIKRMIEDMNE